MSIIGIVNLKTKDKQMDILNKKFNANIRLGRRSDESLATLLLAVKKNSGIAQVKLTSEPFTNARRELSL